MIYGGRCFYYAMLSFLNQFSRRDKKPLTHSILVMNLVSSQYVGFLRDGTLKRLKVLIENVSQIILLSITRL